MTVLFKTPSCLPSCYNTFWLSGQLVLQTVPGALWVPWWVHLSALYLIWHSDSKPILSVCLLRGTCQRQNRILKCSFGAEPSQRCPQYFSQCIWEKKPMNSFEVIWWLDSNMWKSGLWVYEICVPGVPNRFETLIDLLSDLHGDYLWYPRSKSCFMVCWETSIHWHF